MSVFAAVDVGSQAVRLKIARHSRGALERLHRRRIPLRSGDQAFGGGRIGGEVVARMVSALKTCAEESREHGAKLRAVATSSLREAENRDEVLARIRRDAGVELDVISGREEARLVCLGVLEGKAPQLSSLCIDLGGGSVEVALAKGEHPVALHSVAQGALRLARQAGNADVGELRMRAADAVRALPSGLAQGTGGVAVGSSGTIRALVDFICEGTRGYVRKSELGAAVEELAAMNLARRHRWFEPHRAEVIAAGAALLEAVLERLGVDVVHSTKRGLRDGVLIDLSRRPVACHEELAVLS